MRTPQPEPTLFFAGLASLAFPAPMQLYRTILPTPLGEMLALASDEGLCALEFTFHVSGDQVDEEDRTD